MYDIAFSRGQIDIIEKLLGLAGVIKEYQKGIRTTGLGGMTEMKKVG